MRRRAVPRRIPAVAIPWARRLGAAAVISATLAACGSTTRPALEDNSTRDDFGRITRAGQVGVLRLQPGDCFLAGADQIETVNAVPCTSDHDSEVVAVFDLEDTAFPGATAVQEMARQGCLERFTSATGFPYDAEIAELTAYAPTAGSWADDRSVICVALTPDGRLVRGGLTNASA